MTGSKRTDKGSDSERGASPGVGPATTDASRSGKGTGKGKRLRPLAPQEAGSAGASVGEHAGGAPADAAPVRTPASEVKHPLETGTRVDTRWRDGSYHQCRILEKRPSAAWEGPSDHPYAWEYYVHYRRMNRRMDEWVSPENFDFNTVELPAEEIAPDGTRKKKKVEEHSSDDEEHGDFDAQALREHEELTKVKNIDRIELGCHSMPTWYYSPFPPEFRDAKELFFCDFSLHYFKRRSQMLRHMGKCPLRHPPGDEIYRHNGIAMFEVDGRKEKQYCQNLSYLAKLFLDHKTLYWDVDLFFFYVMCEVDSRGAHIVGYFSKEKSSEEGNNLACILTLPAYQRKGYGKFLIAFSYELSKIEGKIGSPERPLSDLGLVSYRGYWTRVLLAVLKDLTGPVSIKELSQMCCIKTEDVITTLQHHGMVQHVKGQHVVCAAPSLVERCLQRAGNPGVLPDPSKIIWTPYDASKEYMMYSTK